MLLTKIARESATTISTQRIPTSQIQLRNDAIFERTSWLVGGQPGKGKAQQYPVLGPHVQEQLHALVKIRASFTFFLLAPPSL